MILPETEEFHRLHREAVTAASATLQDAAEDHVTDAHLSVMNQYRVLRAGHVPFNPVSLPPGAATLGEDDRALLHEILETNNDQDRRHHEKMFRSSLSVLGLYYPSAVPSDIKLALIEALATHIDASS